MTRLFESLNLRPHDRRLIMVVAIVTFIILNFWFVWPHRNAWRDLSQEISDAKGKLARYENEVAQKPAIEAELKKLDQGGAAIAAEGEVDLLRTVQSKIFTTGVEASRLEPRSDRGGTNSFFIEKSMLIQYQNTRDTNLVNFLVSLSSDDSLIRVRRLTIRPDANKMSLGGQIDLVASYKSEGDTAPSSKKTFNAAP